MNNEKTPEHEIKMREMDHFQKVHRVLNNGVYLIETSTFTGSELAAGAEFLGYVKHLKEETKKEIINRGGVIQEHEDFEYQDSEGA
jgi:hypothetical protein